MIDNKELINCQQLILTYGKSNGKLHKDTFTIDMNEMNDMVKHVIEIMVKYSFPSWGINLSEPFKNTKDRCFTKEMLNTYIIMSINDYLESENALKLTK